MAGRVIVSGGQYGHVTFHWPEALRRFLGRFGSFFLTVCAPMNRSVTLRSIQPKDQDFLYQVYASTRTEELAVTDWDEGQKQGFLQMQFMAQHRHYQEHYPAAAFQVIVQHGQPIGRLYVDRWQHEIRIVDIALLPEHRGAGIGSSLLKDILAEGAQTGKPVTIHVEQFNPALRLYERLGFQKIGEVGVYFLMQWSPEHLRNDE
jgi:ribosomal protein S18 acetylase RimI-like enzyme